MVFLRGVGFGMGKSGAEGSSQLDTEQQEPGDQDSCGLEGILGLGPQKGLLRR